jgi:hypothetical protein
VKAKEDEKFEVLKAGDCSNYNDKSNGADTADVSKVIPEACSE